jgi:hypothetical protein
MPLKTCDDGDENNNNNTFITSDFQHEFTQSSSSLSSIFDTQCMPYILG